MNVPRAAYLATQTATRDTTAQDSLRATYQAIRRDTLDATFWAIDGATTDATSMATHDTAYWTTITSVNEVLR